MWTARCRALEWIGLALAAAVPVSAQGLYLHVIPVAAAEEVAAEPGATVRVALTPSDAAAFGPELLAALGASVSEGRVVFDLGTYPQLAGGLSERHRQATFVIDYDQPPVQKLVADLAARYGDDPSVEEIRRFTAQRSPSRRCRGAGIWRRRSPATARATAPSTRCC